MKTKHLSPLYIVISMVAVFSLLSCTKLTVDISQRTVRSTVPKSTMEQINWGVKDFSIDIFRAVSADIEKEVATNLYGQNFMISPLSLAIALAMTEGGAEGVTAEEMKTVLGFSGVSQEVFAAYFKELSITLQTADSKIETNIANSIWSDKFFPIKDSFKDFSEYWYDATVGTRDFKQASTADEINGWCSEMTNGKIPEITDASTISRLCMCLLNALYFKGDWTTEFQSGNTDLFYCHNQGKILAKQAEMGLHTAPCRVPMMFYEGCTLPYAKSTEYTFVEIPYGNGSFAFDILLPEGSDHPEDGIYESIAALNGEKFDSLVSSTQNTRINLVMPGFKMEYTANTLIDNLKSMGMNRAFGLDADFSGISDVNSYIDLITQKTYIEVTEKGTEAAAVTLLGMRKTSVDEVLNLTVNRPFIYVIRETGTNTILFIGAKVTF